MANTEIRLYFLQPKMEKSDYILCSQRWRSSIQSAKTRLEADCGSDHKHLITKFRVKLKKVEVTNRFKGLDLIECLKNYG